MSLEDLIAVAKGELPADLLLTNGRGDYTGSACRV